RAEIAVDEVGDELALWRLQLERRATQLLRRRRREANEQRRGGLASHPDIRISSCYRRAGGAARISPRRQRPDRTSTDPATPGTWLGCCCRQPRRARAPGRRRARPGRPCRHECPEA